MEASHNPHADVQDLARANSLAAQGRDPNGPTREQEREHARTREAQERAESIASAERVIAAREQELASMRAALVSCENAERATSDAYDATTRIVREATDALSLARAALSKAEASYGENGTAANWTKVESARTAVAQSELKMSNAKATAEIAHADYERAKGRRLSAESDARETELRVRRARDTLAGLKSTKGAAEESEAERIGATARAEQEKRDLYGRLYRESTAELAPVLSDAFLAAWMVRNVALRFSRLAAKYRGRFHALNGENCHTPGDQFVLSAFMLYRKQMRIDNDARSIDPLARIAAHRAPVGIVENHWLDAAWEHFAANYKRVEASASTDEEFWRALLNTASGRGYETVNAPDMIDNTSAGDTSAEPATSAE